MKRAEEKREAEVSRMHFGWGCEGVWALVAGVRIEAGAEAEAEAGAGAEAGDAWEYCVFG